MTTTPAPAADQAPALRAAIDHAGYYPGLVTATITAPLGNEPVTAYLVHHDTDFLDAHDDTGAEPGMEMLRHASVLALTPTRLIHSHTDEYQPADPAAPPRAATTTDVVPLARLTMAVHQSVTAPAAYDPAATVPSEVFLRLNWRSRWRAEGGQEHCDDHECQNFHGYLTLTADDLTLQVSHAAHGPGAVTEALAFAAALARATAPNWATAP